MQRHSTTTGGRYVQGNGLGKASPFTTSHNTGNSGSNSNSSSNSSESSSSIINQRHVRGLDEDSSGLMALKVLLVVVPFIIIIIELYKGHLGTRRHSIGIILVSTVVECFGIFLATFPPDHILTDIGLFFALVPMAVTIPFGGVVGLLQIVFGLFLTLFPIRLLRQFVEPIEGSNNSNIIKDNKVAKSRRKVNTDIMWYSGVSLIGYGLHVYADVINNSSLVQAFESMHIFHEHDNFAALLYGRLGPLFGGHLVPMFGDIVLIIGFFASFFSLFKGDQFSRYSCCGGASDSDGCCDS